MGLANQLLQRKHHGRVGFGVTWPQTGPVVVVMAGYGKSNILLRTVLLQGEVFYLPLACPRKPWYRHAPVLGAKMINLTGLTLLHPLACPGFRLTVASLLLLLLLLPSPCSPLRLATAAAVVRFNRLPRMEKVPGGAGGRDAMPERASVRACV